MGVGDDRVVGNVTVVGNRVLDDVGDVDDDDEERVASVVFCDCIYPQATKNNHGKTVVIFT